jgi:hypothetical protein
MRQPPGHAEVGGVADRGFRPERFAQLVVLLDFRVLVVDVQAGGDARGDDAGAEPARGGALALADDPAAEDQRDPVRAAEVEVVADQLLEEEPPGHRGIEHLGEGELRLQHRQFIAVAGRGVLGGERVRQDAQPPGGQRLDLSRVVAGELEAHGAEVLINAVKVMLVHHPEAGTSHG